MSGPILFIKRVPFWVLFLLLKIKPGWDSILTRPKTGIGTDKSIKEKHPAREQEKKKERTKVQTKDHTPNCRTHNGEPSEEKTLNLRPKLNLTVKCQSTLGSNLSLFLKMFFEKGRGIRFGWDFQVSCALCVEVRLDFLKRKIPPFFFFRWNPTKERKCNVNRGHTHFNFWAENGFHHLWCYS